MAIKDSQQNSALRALIFRVLDKPLEEKLLNRTVAVIPRLQITLKFFLDSIFSVTLLAKYFTFTAFSKDSFTHSEKLFGFVS
jgi:hypothetical protein